MTTLRVALLHLRIGVLNDLQYRVNFALQILQSLLALVTGLVVFSLVYSHTAELNEQYVLVTSKYPPRRWRRSPR